jgi:serine/threonine protein kinase
VDDDAPAANSRRASWRQAMNLSHKGLLSVYETGEAELDGDPVAYAALDLPDDDLSEVLERRKLNADEARSMFASVAGALDYLHKRGLRHDAVSPPNLFLVGNEVKLSVDTIAPTNGAGADTDLRQFGGTLVEAITGNAVAANGDDPRQSGAVAQLPPPFYEVAVGCLNNSPDPHWSAARIRDILSARPTQVQQRAARKIERSSGPKSRLWIVGVIGAVAAGLLAAYLFIGKTAPQQPKPARTATAAPPPRTVPAPTPVNVRPVEKPSPARVVDSHAAAPVRQRATPAADAKESWAVIAATYNNFSAAEKRAAALRELSPRLHAHVFPREGAGKRYYVVLGSNLTQDAAQKLRELATSLGAPKDSYVTKLDES